jgi:NAD(P)H-dependent FMN reductase
LFIPVVLGSVREGRNSIFPAQFVLEKIKALGHETELVDFKELPLPFFDSPLVPVALKGTYPHENVQKWSKIARRADAFVLIVSEYNHSYTAVLKNALDWLYVEFEKKPFGLAGVSDGSFGGIRAIEHMRPVIENFSGFAIRETLNFFKSPTMFDKAGKLIDEAYEKRADNFLKSLVWSAEAMKPAREKK